MPTRPARLSLTFFSILNLVDKDRRRIPLHKQRRVALREIPHVGVVQRHILALWPHQLLQKGSLAHLPWPCHQKDGKHARQPQHSLLYSALYIQGRHPSMAILNSYFIIDINMELPMRIGDAAPRLGSPSASIRCAHPSSMVLLLITKEVNSCFPAMRRFQARSIPCSVPAAALPPTAGIACSATRISAFRSPAAYTSPAIRSCWRTV